MGSEATGSSPGTLLMLDFDWTVVDGNTDTEINKLAPNGSIPSADLVQPPGGCWTDLMQATFIYLHKHGVRRDRYVQCMRAMKFTPGMDRLIEKAGSDSRFEVIIVSDSNSFFIDSILEAHGLTGFVRRVLTNPARFDEDGCLRIEYFHLNTECQLSEKNMCKGKIVRDYVQERSMQGVRFDRLAVIGDGKNDYCPVYRVLGPADWAFARKGFTLDKLINQNGKLPCQVQIWETGDEICASLGLK